MNPLLAHGRVLACISRGGLSGGYLRHCLCVGVDVRVRQAESLGVLPASVQTSGNTCTARAGGVWADLHLAGLVAEARVNEEDVVVYSVKRKQVSAARVLLSRFFELLRQVWEARLCLTHMGPLLSLSRPSLMEALLSFDRAHAEFQKPLPLSLQPLKAPENFFFASCPLVDEKGEQDLLG